MSSQRSNTVPPEGPATVPGRAAERGAAAPAGGVRPGRDDSPLTDGLRSLLAVAAGALLSAGLAVALVVTGLFLLPSAGVHANVVDVPPRQPPIIPPSVPLGAREDWAVWTYVDKINRAWGKDWPLVIEWFEELDARYPGNPMVLDKLYAAYIEDGRTRQFQGDLQGARRRYEQASRFDPHRGIAEALLAELDEREAARR